MNSPDRKSNPVSHAVDLPATDAWQAEIAEFCGQARWEIQQVLEALEPVMEMGTNSGFAVAASARDFSERPLGNRAGHAEADVDRSRLENLKRRLADRLRTAPSAGEPGSSSLQRDDA